MLYFKFGEIEKNMGEALALFENEWNDLIQTGLSKEVKPEYMQQLLCVLFAAVFEEKELEIPSNWQQNTDWCKLPQSTTLAKWAMDPNQALSGLATELLGYYQRLDSFQCVTTIAPEHQAQAISEIQAHLASKYSSKLACDFQSNGSYNINLQSQELIEQAKQQQVKRQQEKQERRQRYQQQLKLLQTIKREKLDSLGQQKQSLAAEYQLLQQQLQQALTETQQLKKYQTSQPTMSTPTPTHQQSPLKLAQNTAYIIGPATAQAVSETVTQLQNCKHVTTVGLWQLDVNAVNAAITQLQHYNHITTVGLVRLGANATNAAVAQLKHYQHITHINLKLLAPEITITAYTILSGQTYTAKEAPTEWHRPPQLAAALSASPTTSAPTTTHQQLPLMPTQGIAHINGPATAETISSAVARLQYHREAITVVELKQLNVDAVNAAITQLQHCKQVAQVVLRQLDADAASAAVQLQLCKQVAQVILYQLDANAASAAVLQLQYCPHITWVALGQQLSADAAKIAITQLQYCPQVTEVTLSQLGADAANTAITQLQHCKQVIVVTLRQLNADAAKEAITQLQYCPHVTEVILDQLDIDATDAAISQLQHCQHVTQVTPVKLDVDATFAAITQLKNYQHVTTVTLRYLDDEIAIAAYFTLSGEPHTTKNAPTKWQRPPQSAAALNTSLAIFEPQPRDQKGQKRTAAEEEPDASSHATKKPCF